VEKIVDNIEDIQMLLRKTRQKSTEECFPLIL